MAWLEHVMRHVEVRFFLSLLNDLIVPSLRASPLDIIAISHCSATSFFRLGTANIVIIFGLITEALPS